MSERKIYGSNILAGRVLIWSKCFLIHNLIVPPECGMKNVWESIAIPCHGHGYASCSGVRWRGREQGGSLHVEVGQRKGESGPWSQTVSATIAGRFSESLGAQ